MLHYIVFFHFPVWGRAFLLANPFCLFVWNMNEKKRQRIKTEGNKQKHNWGGDIERRSSWLFRNERSSACVCSQSLESPRQPFSRNKLIAFNRFTWNENLQPEMVFCVRPNKSASMSCRVHIVCSVNTVLWLCQIAFNQYLWAKFCMCAFTFIHRPSDTVNKRLIFAVDSFFSSFFNESESEIRINTLSTLLQMVHRWKTKCKTEYSNSLKSISKISIWNPIDAKWVKY